ncbi:exonuclease SbcD [Parabacteroides sp. PF5-5]|uniref:exonuclease SbcCD subunit D n=1 Tax=unclassified Parabacteroides TaxID=2649774 RepID=UPI00247679F0|nr:MULTISPECIES: exonuclease SbcCD subunit D [unclassified Parabacteroides]MDH6306231.1 exonuclease SbcD [Parabacteroides sp. PH5-39]MDH6317190.1 exonuclease SbcD [Parabacteroides sp. PF5-13]MDH6320943.1 exonuclease SbcD [Parabacteroides sp. PH5-13]MDH6324674.1 exonuclease SbcD [Parabacteroides sp. PH5-8]MDH6328275.1 exonuclease SbcD [Parabacteroides sp. PH5-41]
MALKIIHTADWHLGQTFFGYDREEEHEAFLKWLVDILTQQAADVLLVTGDVFDVANPAASAQRQFFRFLKEANRQNPHLQIIITAGNHDSAARLEAPAPVLEELNTRVIGIIRRLENGAIDYEALTIPLYNRENKREGWCMAVPFLRQGDYPSPDAGVSTYAEGVKRMYDGLYQYVLGKSNPGETIVATGHLHATDAELSADDRSERIIMGGLESVAADTFNNGLDYTALGHIHKAQRVAGRENVRYAGSPLPMSFSETNYRHQVVFVTIEGEQFDIESIPVPETVSLLRIPAQPAEAEELLAALSDLPERDKEALSLYPFLEVRVLMTEPDPGFRHRVEEILENKAVRLTSIMPSYPERAYEERFRPRSFTDLQKIDPLDMLRHTFTARYGDELPAEMEALFNEVIREVEL